MKTRQEKMRPVRTLEAVVKAPGDRPRVTVIAGTREAFESIVGGCVKAVNFTNHNVILCNEDEQAGSLPENAQGIRGTILVLGRGLEDGQFCDVVGPKHVVNLLRDDISDISEAKQRHTA